MFHCVVSLFLLPCVLLTQVAAIGHARCGSQPARHDFRPHFHTNSATDHHHHCHSSHQQHDGNGTPQADMQSAAQPEPLSDHDSDAVFLNNVDLIFNGRFAVEAELSASLLWAAVGLNLSFDGWANPPRAAVEGTHSPPVAECSCPLYVRHLTLLI